MKKNNMAVKASQEQFKHSHWGLRSVEAKGQRSTSRPRAGLDLCWAAEKAGGEEITLLRRGRRSSYIKFINQE